ncbi:MAG: DNA recombination protein RmuC [Deltaproteobacteria bacterium]|nr:DNA recombination protein RmuC [Deltaproteobacteria bacterium]
METIVLSILAVISVICVAMIIITQRSRHNLEQAFREEFRNAREESAKAARELRQEVALAQNTATETLVRTISELGKSQNENLGKVAGGIKELTETNEARIERMRSAIDHQLKVLTEGNEKKLDQMRLTVDEKLQSTLEKRLGESFKLVSERLEAVQRGLGEMQTLATGVGDLKRVLTNVKARGTWAEVQLGALLEQILSPDQYARNVQVKHDSRETVEYAVCLPGAGDMSESRLWLPIDSKFPQEDYLRLVDASDRADAEACQKATSSLLRSVQASAKEISEKYVSPPETTDFAIMFLPTEGLYAEVLRQPGQVEEIQRRYRIVLAGPTTLAAILSSIRMGFQTLALEKRSHEVWSILAAVKTEFLKFGDVLSKVRKQLNTASSTIEQTEIRTRAMTRKLRDVEQLPESESTYVLGLDKNPQRELIEEENDS